MSEDCVTIYRKIDESLTADQAIVNAFVDHHEIAESSSYQEGEYHCYALGFFTAEQHHLETLLHDLYQQAPFDTVAEYYFEQAGEKTFYVLLDGRINEFDEFESAINALKLNDNELSLTKEFKHDLKTSSIIKVYPKKANKQKLIDYFSGEIAAHNTQSNIRWNGELELLLKFGKDVIDRGSYFVVVIDIYCQELFYHFPNAEDIKEAIAENQRMNIDIRETQTRDLSKLGFSDEEVQSMLWLLPEDEESSAQGLKVQKLAEAAETFLDKLLNIKGINSGSLVLRSQLLEEDEQIGGQGIHKEGALFCHLEEYSDVSEWVC